MGDRSATDLAGGEAIRLYQQIAGASQVAHLSQTTRHVEQMVRAALRHHGRELERVYSIVSFDRPPTLAHLHIGGGAVDGYVGGTEVGPVVVLVAPKLFGRLLGADEKIANRGRVTEPAAAIAPSSRTMP